MAMRQCGNAVHPSIDSNAVRTDAAGTEFTVNYTVPHQGLLIVPYRHGGASEPESFKKERWRNDR